MNRPTVIKVRNLTKEFGTVRAVSGLDFEVKKGEVYGFLGPNGAGKSTTIRMLLTLVRPDGGDIEIFGLKLSKHRKEILQKVGAIIERPDHYKYLSGLENLKLFANMSAVRPGRKQLMEYLDLVGLSDRADTRIRAYSQGMKQRLGIAIALIHNPELIILDEPTNGLDPNGLVDIRKLIRTISREMGKTIFLSSHLLSEVEQVADNMLIINKGKKVVEGGVRELLDKADAVVELKARNIADTLNKLSGSDLVPMIRAHFDDRVVFRMPRNRVTGFYREILNLGIDVDAFQTLNALEEYFLNLTNEAKYVATAED